MSVSIQFDPNQKFQLDAIRAAVDLFAGQERSAGAGSFVVGAGGASLYQGELGTGNRLDLKRAQLLANLRLVQERQGLLPDASLLPVQPEDEKASAPLNYTVEMETGTGKTYVYLRTLREIHATYGWSKFVVVVPSVAIREGVLQALKATDEHLKSLYGGEPLDFFVYDGKKPAQLANFARATCPTVCVINVQAFIKDSDGAGTGNVIYKTSDALPGGRAPIDFMRECSPIVVVDEPQSVDGTDKAKAALRRLNPLMTLRFSATHKEPFNVIYRLSPIRARKLKLVKGIVVSSVSMGNSVPPGAYLKLEEVGYSKTKKPQAKLRMMVVGKDGASQKSKTIKGTEDLFMVSGEHEPYRDMFVEQVDAARQCVVLSTGVELKVNDEVGGMGDDLLKLMVKKTVEKHLEKEVQLAGRLHQNKRVKVLSLFFLDRVADYRLYDDAGNPQPGKVAQWFKEAYETLIKQPRFAGLPTAALPLDKLHDGYFAQDKKSKQVKDTNGSTEADTDAYELIMKDKGRLLDPDEPLRFLFSHSALREGWDNPNVFQICKLGGAQTTTRRRQELGRGLRLPVDETGARLQDERINDLTVIGSEDYNSFAKALQQELLEECGETFGKVIPAAFAAIEKMTDGGAKALGFDKAKELWETLRTVGVLTEDGSLVPDKDLSKLADWLPTDLKPLHTEIVKVLEEHRLERMARKDEPRRKVALNKRVADSPEFRAMWEKISRKTRYRVAFDGDDLVAKAVKAIQHELPVLQMEAWLEEGRAEVSSKGVQATMTRTRKVEKLEFSGELPDPILFLQGKTDLTRTTLAKILAQCGRLADFSRNPQRFLDEVAAILSRLLAEVVVDGVRYEPIPNEGYEQLRLNDNGDEEIESLVSRLVDCPEKAAINPVEVDSDTERRFAERLNTLEDVVRFIKLPKTFRVPTPVGDYIPDWAMVRKDDEGRPRLFLVRETKGTLDESMLRGLERAKIKCAKEHFKALEVDYKVAVSVEDI